MGAPLESVEIERLLGQPPRITIEDILNHPEFAEARRAYLSAFLKVYDGDPFLVRLLIDPGDFSSITSFCFSKAHTIPLAVKLGQP